MPQTPDPARHIRSVCVYCGSAGAVDERYRAAAAELGQSLAAAGMTMVFGGGHIGLMGVAADAARQDGEGVGALGHDALAVVHRVEDDKLADAGMR